VSRGWTISEMGVGAAASYPSREMQSASDEYGQATLVGIGASEKAGTLSVPGGIATASIESTELRLACSWLEQYKGEPLARRKCASCQPLLVPQKATPLRGAKTRSVATSMVRLRSSC